MSQFENYKVLFGNDLVDFKDAHLHIASAAALYGLSVYTVFPVCISDKGTMAFRLPDHFKRLLESSKIIGIDSLPGNMNYDSFVDNVKKLVHENNINEDVFVRATIHVVELLPGTRSRGLQTKLSMFVFPANPILKPTGARVKSSVWRRVPDYAIPARAKVNGAYVNSVLGKQDAIDSGYDDCVFLDAQGHVCELSAANLFLVKNKQLITPDTTSDLLEGINRRTVLEIARSRNIDVVERPVDLTELYTADEVFASGTSAMIAPIIEVDARKIGNGEPGVFTKNLGKLHYDILHGIHDQSLTYLTKI